MTPNGLLEEIKQLPVEQRIELIQKAWDSIVSTADEVPLPEGHRRILEQRLKNPSPKPSLSWEEVRARLADPE